LPLVLATLLLSCCAATDKPPGPGRAEEQVPGAEQSQPGKAAARLRQLRPRIAELVARLGSAEYRARQEAQAALREIGLPAVPALEEAAKSTDAEVSHAAALLLESLKPSVESVVVKWNPRSTAQWWIEKTLKAAPVIGAMPKARLLSVLKSLGSQTNLLNFLAHPDLLTENPEVELDGANSLPNALEKIAKSLQSAWVARFGVLYLAKPAIALELANAQILTSEGQDGSNPLLLMREKTVRISLKKTSLAKALDFFTELNSVVPVYGKGLSPDTEVSRFEVSDISASDALSLLLFSLNLKARLSEDRITISKGDYGKYSEDYRSQQSLLEEYRKAWKSLSSSSP
jgi:hypothetical protein